MGEKSEKEICQNSKERLNILTILIFMLFNLGNKRKVIGSSNTNNNKIMKTGPIQKRTQTFEKEMR